MTEPDNSTPSPNPAGRREFLKSAACALVGGACVLPPVVAGVVVLTAPIRTRTSDGVKVKLSDLDALTPGGAPRLFKVVVERTDAWTRHDRSEIGAVFLARKSGREVEAFNASCPHLGCSVVWRTEQKDYFCPCHDSAFTAAGAVVQPSAASRGMDSLEVEVNEAGEVWVKFQDFKAGIAEKIAVS